MAMRITPKKVDAKFQRVFHSLGLNTDQDSKLVRDKKTGRVVGGYDKDHFRLDHNTVYGYEIHKIDKGETGVSVFNPGGRMTNQEMWKFLDGMEVFSSRADCMRMGFSFDEKKGVCKIGVKAKKK